MAITSAIMQMRRGYEADFDPDKMRPGEWAVSTDTKYVRMCFYPGVCVRMATYDAFEADMAKIETILAECQTIEEAVTRINTEISEKANAVAEYTEQSKGYRDETKQFRDGAETSATNAKSSEDKAKVSETNAKVSEINAKISEENAQRVAESLPEDYTELSKAFYNTAIKQKAVGDNIHVTDSADSKIVEFGLYGKAEQKQYSGKNLYDEVALNKEYSLVGVTLKKDAETGNMIISGTATASNNMIMNPFTLPAGTYYYQRGNVTNCSVALYNQTAKTFISTHKELSFTLTEESVLDIRVQTATGQSPSGTIKIQIEEGPIMTDYEPYVGGIPSPNPDYPQEITVSGSDGSVEVVSCGKNLYDNINNFTPYKRTGVSISKGTEDTFDVIGTTSGSINAIQKPFSLPKGKYILSTKKYDSNLNILLYNQNKKKFMAKGINAQQKEVEIVDEADVLDFRFQADSGVTLNVTGQAIMIRLASDTNDTYEPYKETTSTIPTPNGIAGIKVDSGGNYTDENGQQWVCDEIVKYADGSGKRVQRIGKKVVTSAGGTVASTNTFVNFTRFYINTFNDRNKSGKPLDGICDIATFDGSKKSDSKESIGKCYFNEGEYFNFFYIHLSKEALGISVSDDTETQKALANEWLASNPMTVYYELAEPIITDLTAEEIAEIEKLHTFYPVTNISNDAECGMAVTYMADAKNYIDNRLALLETALVNSI